jgi:Tfp pilus assembly protein PilE
MKKIFSALRKELYLGLIVGILAVVVMEASRDRLQEQRLTYEKRLADMREEVERAEKHCDSTNDSRGNGNSPAQPSQQQDIRTCRTPQN